MIITIEKYPANPITFAYVWSGEPNQSPPIKSFHTFVEGAEGEMIVTQKACKWVAAQQKDAGDLAICAACGEPLQYHVGGAERGLCKNPPSA